MNRPNLNLLVDHDFNLFKGPNGSLKLPPQNVRNSDGLHFHYHSNPEIQDGYRDGKSAGYVVEPRTAHAGGVLARGANYPDPRNSWGPGPRYWV